MERHFVEGMFGSLYFSYDDKESIEEYDEDLGDYDQVLFTYDDEVKNEPYKSLVNYYTTDLVLTKKSLERKLYNYNAYERGIKPVLKEIKENIVFDADEAKDIFKILLEENEIDQKTYDKLVKTFNKLVKKQYDFINNFDYSKIKLVKQYNKIKKKSI